MLPKLRGSLRFIVGFFAGVLTSIACSHIRSYYTASKVLRLSDVDTHVLDNKLSARSSNSSVPSNNSSSPLQDVAAHPPESAASRVRVLVMVITAPKNKHKALAVKETWGKRAEVLYMSSSSDPSVPTVELDIPRDTRRHLTAKTMQGFHYMHDHHVGEYDWFMKADDNTYVIMENLKYFLSDHVASDPVYFGHLLDAHVAQGYNSGGAGYVLSKEALIRLNTQGKEVCRQDGGDEDVEMGKCMDALGVKTGNTTDALGRSRFHALWPEKHLGLVPPVNTDEWIARLDANGIGLGPPDTMSDLPISFHYMTPPMMTAMEYYVYRLRPYDPHQPDPGLNARHVNRLLTRNSTT